MTTAANPTPPFPLSPKRISALTKLACLACYAKIAFSGLRKFTMTLHENAGPSSKPAQLQNYRKQRVCLFSEFVCTHYFALDTQPLDIGESGQYNREVVFRGIRLSWLSAGRDEPFFLLRGHRPAFFFSRLGLELELKRNIVCFGRFCPVPPCSLPCETQRRAGCFCASAAIFIRLVETERTVSLCRRSAN